MNNLMNLLWISNSGGDFYFNQVIKKNKCNPLEFSSELVNSKPKLNC